MSDTCGLGAVAFSFSFVRTFCIHTLGCKVNQYEAEQVATLLRARGLSQVADAAQADLNIVNTCSVTVQAASKSRQAVRQAGGQSGRVIVLGCWATSDPGQAAAQRGVRAVVGHQHNVAEELDRLLSVWQSEDAEPPKRTGEPNHNAREPVPEARDEGLIMRAGTPGDLASIYYDADYKDEFGKTRREKSEKGTIFLPQLASRQSIHQRALLKIQDGCDGRCTYCIIPTLRSRLWSKPADQVVAEARALVAAGHRELVLTGIFLGAYGQPTALRRHQSPGGGRLARLIDAICQQVPDLLRLRLSSLEPGDLDHELLETLKRHPQVVPHFHLPLQSGSNRILGRMNRQYRREDYLSMIERVNVAFDRPAITTDIMVGFPGEEDDDFSQTMDVVKRAKFIHIHSFPFSPRPGTPAARWTKLLPSGRAIQERLAILNARAREHCLAFRQQFLNQTVEILVERCAAGALTGGTERTASECTGGTTVRRHGRCERYFSVSFASAEDLTGQAVKVRIDRVTDTATFGSLT